MVIDRVVAARSGWANFGEEDTTGPCVASLDVFRGEYYVEDGKSVASVAIDLTTLDRGSHLRVGIELTQTDLISLIARLITVYQEVARG